MSHTMGMMSCKRYPASLVNGPMAAAIAYGLNNRGGKSQIIICDLSGGTFNVLLLSILDNGVFKVLATTGDTHLSGEDFNTNHVIDYLIKQYKKKTD